jgi:hypothetical protein
MGEDVAAQHAEMESAFAQPKDTPSAGSRAAADQFDTVTLGKGPTLRSLADS